MRNCEEANPRVEQGEIVRRPEGVVKSGPDGEEGNYLFCSFLVVTHVYNKLEPSHYQVTTHNNIPPPQGHINR